MCTCVALQLLHDLLRLQVPDVNHVVLGARHDPLQREEPLSYWQQRNEAKGRTAQVLFQRIQF